MIDKYEKADDKTIVMTTKYPFSFLPYLLTRILIVSPTQWEAVGKNWAEFAKKPVRHRAVQDHQGGARPICRDVAQRGLLGQGAHPEAGQDDRLSDAGSDHPGRRAALRAGGLDRGAAAGFHPVAEAAGLQISLWPYPHTYPYALNCTGQLAVQGCAGAPGAQLRDRPRGHVQDAERHRQAGGRACIRRTIRCSARRRTTTTTIRKRRRRC